MIRAAVRLLGCLLLSSIALTIHGQFAPTDDAVAEAVRRQASRVELGQRLVEAETAVRAGDHLAAATLYDKCHQLVRHVGSGVEAEQAQVLSGLTSTRLHLAEQAQRSGNYLGADDHVSRVLVVDPKNPAALEFKRQNDRIRLTFAGKMPHPEVVAELPKIYSNKVEIATLVQDGKVLYEAGKFDEAEKKLRLATRADPDNRGAFYYLDKVLEQKYLKEQRNREVSAKDALIDVARDWATPIKRESLPTPNPYARTNLVHTSKGRQAIFSKMERIRLGSVKYDGLPLADVIKVLSEDVRKSDTDKRGLNFILNYNVDPPVSVTVTNTDPTTGQPVVAAAQTGIDPESFAASTIRIDPPLVDVTLAEVLDAIQRVSTPPVKYSVEDYAIVFSPRAPEAPVLHTRFFKVDPNTFVQGLSGVSIFGFTGGGGGGGQGGGGGGGGGRGGGGGGGGGGQSGQQNEILGSEVVGVSVAPRIQVGGQGGGQQQQVQGGWTTTVGPGAAPGTLAGTILGTLRGAAAGMSYVTRETPTMDATVLVQTFFQAAGVNIVPPKSVFFNDRLGMLMVRATLQELDIIEQAIQVLNMSPPQVSLEAKFYEVTQDDRKALGFDWYLGNTTVNGGRIGAQGGTAPSYQGRPSFANPSGVFPGPLSQGLPTPATIFPAGSDNFLTAGLRNGANAPAVATLTGILTDPQFRVVIRALEQRGGADLLSAPRVTTVSARQAQMKSVEVRYLVTDLNLNQTAGGGGVTAAGTAAGGGVVGSTIQAIATPIELGPVLDVIPYVSADGYTIQMTIIPTVKEFVGYDLETAALFSSQVQSVGAGGALNPLTTTTPLPTFRLRQVVTSAIVWDGQTVVLGGLIAEDVVKRKDKIPVLGDLPLAGKLFRSESSTSIKKNLLIFVTPTIIDPAGNRVHSEEEMPFALNAIPPQKSVNPQ